MSTPKLPRAGMSARDRKLILAFAFFAEAVILYMGLVDPLITRLARARSLEESTRHAHAELSAALLPEPRAPLTAPTEAKPAPLSLGQRESATVAIQRVLGQMASETGVRLGQVTIAPTPEPRGGLASHAVDVEVSGAYEAVSAFIGGLEAPEPVRGIEVFEIATAEGDADAIRATLTLRFYLRTP